MIRDWGKGFLHTYYMQTWSYCDLLPTALGLCSHGAAGDCCLLYQAWLYIHTNILSVLPPGGKTDMPIIPSSPCVQRASAIEFAKEYYVVD